TVGWLSRNDELRPVTLAPGPETEGCPAGTSPNTLTASLEAGAGAYTGTLDVNGSADGGAVTLTVNAERHAVVFYALLVAGFLVATVVSWWVRSGREWGFVDETEAEVRHRVWDAQE